jgi:hypothetical protein
MAAIQIIETHPITTDRQLEYELQLMRVRQKLARLGISMLAATEGEGTCGRKLAEELDAIEEIGIDPHDNLQDVLEASSRREKDGRIIAGILPLQISGMEKPLPLDEDGGQHVMEAIHEKGMVGIAKIQMPTSDESHVAMGIVMGRAF